jgi:hypothetical protein
MPQLTPESERAVYKNPAGTRHKPGPHPVLTTAPGSDPNPTLDAVKHQPGGASTRKYPYPFGNTPAPGNTPLNGGSTTFGGGNTLTVTDPPTPTDAGA